MDSLRGLACFSKATSTRAGLSIVVGRICRQTVPASLCIYPGSPAPLYGGLPCGSLNSQLQEPKDNLTAPSQIPRPDCPDCSRNSYPLDANFNPSQSWHPNPSYRMPVYSPPIYPQTWYAPFRDSVPVQQAYSRFPPGPMPSNHLYSSNQHHRTTYSYPESPPQGTPQYKPFRDSCYHTPSHTFQDQSKSSRTPGHVPPVENDKWSVHTADNVMHTSENAAVRGSEDAFPVEEPNAPRPRFSSVKEKAALGMPPYTTKSRKSASHRSTDRAVIPSRPIHSNPNYTTYPNRPSESAPQQALVPVSVSLPNPSLSIQSVFGNIVVPAGADTGLPTKEEKLSVAWYYLQKWTTIFSLITDRTDLRVHRRPLKENRDNHKITPPYRSREIGGILMATGVQHDHDSTPGSQLQRRRSLHIEKHTRKLRKPNDLDENVRNAEAYQTNPARAIMMEKSDNPNITLTYTPQHLTNEQSSEGNSDLDRNHLDENVRDIEADQAKKARRDPDIRRIDHWSNRGKFNDSYDGIVNPTPKPTSVEVSCRPSNRRSKIYHPVGKIPDDKLHHTESHQVELAPDETFVSKADHNTSVTRRKGSKIVSGVKFAPPEPPVRSIYRRPTVDLADEQSSERNNDIDLDSVGE